MAKLFLLIIISLIIKSEGRAEIAEHDYYLIDDYDYDDKTRVAAGTDSNPRENLDYVRLDIVFQNVFRTCGGTLIKGLYVLTSATCLYE